MLQTSSRCSSSAPCCPQWLKMPELLEDNPFSTNLSFSDGSGRFFSRPWSVSRQKRLTLDQPMLPPFWTRNGGETAHPKYLYGPNDGSEVWVAAARTTGPSSRPYRHICRTVSQPFLPHNHRYIAPTYLYIS